jgi:crotonobetainyl-CoA:carnitine CoA-transferase CaiB-like acyl-CoA transferase
MVSPAQRPPLEGIRVIELARVLAGPWAGQLMADMGADVIKVENPDGGDDTRHWGPPFIAGADGDNLSAAYFHATNRGKRSVLADFRTEEGRELVRRLVRSADVVIENFKVGGLAKYDLDYAGLSEINPAIVWCSITGFGQTGPYASYAGYDFIVQGMSGFMSITGEPQGEPMKAGTAIADLFTGIYAVTAIEAALIRALKTGKGDHIDMALLDVQSGILANQNLNYLAAGVNPARIGNAHLNIVPYQVFAVANGHLILAVGNDGQFHRLCTILKQSELADDPRFSTNQARIANRTTLIPLLQTLVSAWQRDDLLHACEAHAVPAGPINTVEQMFADPQIIARQLRLDMRDDHGNPIPGVRSPILFAGTPIDHSRPSPRLGQHHDEVMAELDAIEAQSE